MLFGTHPKVHVAVNQLVSTLVEFCKAKFRVRKCNLIFAFTDKQRWVISISMRNRESSRKKYGQSLFFFSFWLISRAKLLIPLMTLPVCLSVCPPPDVTLCEEAVYQSLSSLRLSSVPLERLLENLPGRKVDRKSLEKLKKSCSPQQQVLHLLRLWREQNKDQDKLYGIIQGGPAHSVFNAYIL